MPKKTPWNEDPHSCGPKKIKPTGVAAGTGLDATEYIKELIKRKKEAGRMPPEPKPEDN